MTSSSRAPIVIVPGTGCGRWTYEPLAAALVELTGRSVVTLALAGMGERASEIEPGIDVDAHVNDVVAQLEAHNVSGVTLVGHSYGGAVVTGATKSERVARAVYLDAFVPRNGESILDQHKGFGELIKSAVGDGWQIPKFPGNTLTAHESTVAAFDRHATSSPFRMYASALTVDEDRFARVPKGYVAFTRQKFRYFAKLAEQKRAQGWSVATVDADHLAPYSEPLATARAILEAEPA